MFVLAIFLAILTLLSISLQKTYSKVPLKELKRRATKGDEVAIVLHRAVSYGFSLNLLLWIIIGLSASCFFVVLSKSLPSFMAIFGCAALLWFGFAWMPNSNISNLGQSAAKKAAPLLSKTLAYLYPLLSKLGHFIKLKSRITVHSGLYQKEDLIDLLEKQAKQPDNRMTKYELDIVKSVLSYSDKIIRDCMTPKRVVKTVSANEAIGPILMTELHKSGYSRFPVTGDKEDEIIGTLYLRDLVNVKSGGLIKDHMSKKVIYVNEEKPLQHALQAFLKTKHHLFIVVNSFEEIVGIITIEDVLEQILGKQIVDEFDKFEDMRAVAKLQAKKDSVKHVHAPEHEEDSIEKKSELDSIKDNDKI